MLKNLISKLNKKGFKLSKKKINFLTFTIALVLTILYITEPQRKLFKAKDICGRWWMNQLSEEIAYKKLGLKPEGDLIEYCVHFR